MYKDRLRFDMLRQLMKLVKDHKGKLAKSGRDRVDVNIVYVICGFLLSSSRIVGLYRWLRPIHGVVLDVGCGRGLSFRAVKLMSGEKIKATYTIGVDIFRQYLVEAKKQGIYDDVIHCDVRCLPVKSKSVETCFLLDVIEHLEKKEGLALLVRVESMAKRQIMITTPNGFSSESVRDNPFWLHRSGWHSQEFAHLKYKVRGIKGTKIYTKIRYHKLLHVFLALNPFYLMFTWFIAYFLPSIASELLCVKFVPNRQLK